VTRDQGDAAQAGGRAGDRLLKIRPTMIAAPLLMLALVVALAFGQSSIWLKVIALTGAALILLLSFARIVVRIRRSR
jgi:hypothetical protein